MKDSREKLKRVSRRFVRDTEYNRLPGCPGRRRPATRTYANLIWRTIIRRSRSTQGEQKMRYRMRMLVLCSMLGLAAPHAAGQDAGNKFPLAAPAGKDSNARQVAPPGAVN